MSNDLVTMRLQGLDGVLDLLKQLPPEVVSKRGGVARASLRKGAMVLVKEAQANFSKAVNLPGRSGVTESTGFTQKQIVAKRKTPPAGTKGEKFIVAVNYVEHPAGRSARRKSRAAPDTKRRARKRLAKAIRANDIAFMMEYGTSKQPATPWLRPAFKSKAQVAIQTVETELVKGLDRAVKKLAKGKGLR